MVNHTPAKVARTWPVLYRKRSRNNTINISWDTGIKDYRSAQGICGVYVFRRNEGELTHFLLLTLWVFYDSIRQFSGDDITRARYYPKDSEFLIELEPFVTHYEILWDFLSVNAK